jgi:beta-lactamase regulating signal transducer with metallopeptidase domain
MAIEWLVLTFVLNALWQIPVVVAAGLLGDRLLRRAASRLRHLLWLTILAVCLLLPAASLLPAPPARGAAVITNALRPVDPADGAKRPDRPLDTPRLAARPGPEPRAFLEIPARLPPLVAFLAALAYGASLLFFGLRLGRSWWRTRGLARRAREVEIPEEMASIVSRCRAAFACGRAEILETPEVSGPATLGSSRPLILLPPRFFAGVSADEATSALGHEMAHVRRRDYAVNLLSELLLLPIAFHPAARSIRRRLVETRELACDEAVLESLVRPRVYARSLLSLATAAAAPCPFTTLGAVDAPTLEVRMRRILEDHPRPGAWATRARLGAALLLLAGLGTAASLFPLRSAVAEEIQDSVASAANPCEGPGPAHQVAAGEAGWTNLVPANGTGQTFTATRRHITGIEVDLLTGNPQGPQSLRGETGDTLTLSLSSFHGDLLAQSRRRVASGHDGWLCFPMPQDGVDVEPGETLVLRLRDTGKVIFGWRYGGDTYPRGHALMIHRANRSFDFAFRAHDATAQATTP